MHRSRNGAIRLAPEAGHRPVRTCVGCGRKATKEELVRLVQRDGTLVAGDQEPGRGAYTCRRLACFERAVSKNAFNRTLRRTVRFRPELLHLYTER